MIATRNSLNFIVIVYLSYTPPILPPIPNKELYSYPRQKSDLSLSYSMYIYICLYILLYIVRVYLE